MEIDNINIKKLVKWSNTIYININKCYNLSELCSTLDIYIVKIGSSKYLPARYYNYTTYTPNKTNILRFYHLHNYNCYQLDNDLKNVFNKERLHEHGGGTEFYYNSVLDKLEDYMHSKNIEFTRYEDISDFPQNNSNMEIEYFNDNRRKKNYIEKLNEDIIVNYDKELNNHQLDILYKTVDYYKTNNLGIWNLFCRYGKTRLSSLYCKYSNYKKILVLVPSLYLVEQTYLTWKLYFNNSNIIKVSSNDPDTSNLEYINEIYKLRQQCIFITTYNSSHKFQELDFEIGIYDESHRTTGDTSDYKILLKTINIKHKLFLTATLKFYEYNNNDDSNTLKIYSMDDIETYGNVISSVSARKALELKRICPYSIMTIKLNSNIELEESISNLQDINRIINDYIDVVVNDSLTNDKSISVIKDNKNRYIRIAYGLLKTIKQNNIKHIITFHRYILCAKLFTEIIKAFVKLDKNFENIKVVSIDGNIIIKERTRMINKFEDIDNKYSHTLLCSAKILQEGVDIPHCDGICFVDLKTSSVDTIQSISRCLTFLENKKAFIMIPFDETDIIPNNNESIKFTPYAMNLRLLLRNIVEIDENAKAYFRLCTNQIISNMSNKCTEGNINTIDTELYNCIVDASIIREMSEISFEVFNVAKKRIKEIGYISEKDYKNRVEIDFNGDIPKEADKIYKSFGWHGWNDYLGIDPFMTLLQVQKHMYRVNSLHIIDNTTLVDSRDEYYKYAKENNLMVEIDKNRDKLNWCWLLLPNYNELVEVFYKTKEDISKAIIKLNIKSIKQYEDKYHIDIKLPKYKYIINGFYNDKIPSIGNNFSSFISSLYDIEDTMF